MKKLLSIAFLLMMSIHGFSQLLTNKINNTAVIYGANSTLTINGNEFVSNMVVRGFIFQNGVAGVNGSSNLFMASSNTFTGRIAATGNFSHQLAGITFNFNTIGSSGAITVSGSSLNFTPTGLTTVNSTGLIVTNNAFVYRNLTVSNNLVVAQTSQLGTNGSAFVFLKTATASLDYGNILAAGFEDLTITVGGAAANDAVILGNPVDQDGSLDTEAFVSAANTVTVRAHNVGSLAVDQASKTYRVTVVHY